MSTEAKADRLARIRKIIAENREAGRDTYAGLQSHEVGEHSRAIMFGENDENFPSQDEWSRIVD